MIGAFPITHSQKWLFNYWMPLMFSIAGWALFLLGTYCLKYGLFFTCIRQTQSSCLCKGCLPLPSSLLCTEYWWRHQGLGIGDWSLLWNPLIWAGTGLRGALPSECMKGGTGGKGAGVHPLCSYDPPLSRLALSRAIGQDLLGCVLAPSVQEQHTHPYSHILNNHTLWSNKKDVGLWYY